VFTVPVVARLHELNHATVQVLAGGAHHQAQGGGGFAFAVSSVNDEEAASVLLIISATPFVFAFDGYS